MDKRDLTTFQEILVNYFEEEVLERLEARGTRIVDEEEVLEIVDETHREMEEVIEAIRAGAISVTGLEPGEGGKYH